MNKVYLLLGTNLGDKKDNILKACEKISNSCGYLVAQSLIYETSPWGIEAQPVFYNKVIAIETINSAQKLLENLQTIELEMGRVREIKWGERIIDIDILYFNNEIVSNENLIIPHPEIQNRRFTLVPLCEIAADYKHPLLKLSNQQLLDNCEDMGSVAQIITL